MAQEEKGKLKELYTRYNQCRDAELDRFWKNSVFVWVFLSLCFTAFGILVKEFNMPNTKLKPLSPVDYYQFLLIVSGIGLILSLIWVWMARGLKAWYEVYESAIWEIETYKNEFKYPRKYLINNFWSVKESDCCLKRLVTDSKPISPSKIVILIGCLLVTIWGGALFYSIWQYWFCKISTCCYYCEEGCFCYDSICHCDIQEKHWFIFLGSIVVIIISLIGFRIFAKSSTLRNKEDKNIFDKIRNDIDKRVFTSDEIMSDDEIEKFYDFYLEVKKGKVKFIFFDRTQYKKGLLLIPKFYQCVQYGCGDNMSLTMELNDIEKYYLNRNVKEIRDSFSAYQIKTDNICMKDKRIFIYIKQSEYNDKKYMIATCIASLTGNCKLQEQIVINLKKDN